MKPLIVGALKLKELKCKIWFKIILKNLTAFFQRKDVRLPIQLQRSMATEAEATREARAKVVAAEGEQKASVALKEAADIIIQSPIALQLRYMQTLTNIAGEKNSTIIFPIPIDFMQLVHDNNAES
jgi:erythrocyte band 7 integral membrane protein